MQAHEPSPRRAPAPPIPAAEPSGRRPGRRGRPRVPPLFERPAGDGPRAVPGPPRRTTWPMARASSLYRPPERAATNRTAPSSAELLAGPGRYAFSSSWRDRRNVAAAERKCSAVGASSAMATRCGTRWATRTLPAGHQAAVHRVQLILDHSQRQIVITLLAKDITQPGDIVRRELAIARRGALRAISPSVSKNLILLIVISGKSPRSWLSTSPIDSAARGPAVEAAAPDGLTRSSFLTGPNAAAHGGG